MRRELAVGVGAHRAALDRDAREGLVVLGDVGHGTAVDVDGEHAVCLGAAALRCRRLLDRLARNAQHRREPVDDRGVVLHLGIGEHDKRGAVANQLDAVAVEDAPAGRHGGVLGDAVGLGPLGVLFAGHDLHRPELGDERCHRRADQAEEDEEAAAHRDLAVAGARAFGANGHALCPLAAKRHARLVLASRPGDEDYEDNRRYEEQDNRRCAEGCNHG